MKTKLSLILLLLFSLIALSACLALTSQEEEEDPELKTCKHQCKQQQQYSEKDKKKCMERCDEYYEEKKERERRKEHEKEEKGDEEEGSDEERNRFIFEEDQFETIVETDDGTIRVLPKFTENNDLLRGIENCRLLVLEARQHSFVAPSHFDAELIIFTVQGRASVGLVKEDETAKFNLERGDIMRIQSGTPFYIVNRDENEKLILAHLYIPISIPGEFKAFHGPGGRDPESVLRAFSWDVLEASLKGNKATLEMLFGKQKKGGIFRISRDQVKSLSKGWEIPSLWPFGGQDKGPFNLFKTKPFVSNEYGRLFEARPEDHDSLASLNLMISFADITNGSMSAPMHNTRAMKIGVVTEGWGKLEMVTPYMSEQEERSKERSPRNYRRVSGELRTGVVFVVPAGHPWVLMASTQSNLQVLCFEVNARGNLKLALAGRRNVVKAMDKVARELAFNWPAERVDAIFSRKEDFFFPGPQNLEDEDNKLHGRAYA